MHVAAIQVRDVPEELHEALRERAQTEGVSLGAYVLEVLRRDLRRPRLDQWAERQRDALASVGAAPDGVAPGVAADVVRDARAERTGELDDRSDR